MTGRLLILGNSHIRALRDAFETQPERWSRIEVDMIGLRHPALDGVDLTGGAFVPRTDEAIEQFERLNPGRRSFSVTGYDTIAVVGLDFKPLNVIALSRGATWFGLPSLTDAGDLATMRPTLMSRQAAAATIEASLLSSDAAQLARALRAEVDCPIHIVPCPRLSHKSKWTDVPRFYGHGRAVKAGDAAELDALWEATARHVAQRVGARYIAQPRDTIIDEVMTRRKFMTEAEVSLPTANGPRKVPDMTHANVAYGTLILQRLMRKTLHAAAQNAGEDDAAEPNVPRSA